MLFFPSCSNSFIGHLSEFVSQFQITQPYSFGGQRIDAGKFVLHDPKVEHVICLCRSSIVYFWSKPFSQLKKTGRENHSFNASAWVNWMRKPKFYFQILLLQHVVFFNLKLRLLICHEECVSQRADANALITCWCQMQLAYANIIFFLFFIFSFWREGQCCINLMYKYRTCASAQEAGPAKERELPTKPFIERKQAEEEKNPHLGPRIPLKAEA